MAGNRNERLKMSEAIIEFKPYTDLQARHTIRRHETTCLRRRQHLPHAHRLRISETMKTEISAKEQAKRLQHWLDTMDFLPAASPEGIERDRFWRHRLKTELQELQKESIRSQLNFLSHLAKARNSLRELIP